MATEDFVSVKNVRSLIVYRKVNKYKEKVNWLGIHWLRFSKDHPLEIQYRYSHNSLEVRKTLDVHPRRPGLPADVGRATLVPLYTRPRPLQENKLQDLKVLMQFIPPVHYPFYNALEQATEGNTESGEEIDTD